MAETVVVAQVWIWKHFVGAVAEANDGQITRRCALSATVLR